MAHEVREGFEVVGLLKYKLNLRQQKSVNANVHAVNTHNMLWFNCFLLTPLLLMHPPTPSSSYIILP